MMKLIISLVCFAISAVIADSHYGGLAMSANEDVIRQGKNVAVKYLREMFKEVHIDDFNIQMLGTEKLSNMKFEGVEINEDDIEIKIVDRWLEVNIKNMGGKITGHSWKKVLFGEEVFDFDINCRKGGIMLHLSIEI